MCDDFLLFEAFFDFDIFIAFIWRYYYCYYSPLTFQYHSALTLLLLLPTYLLYMQSLVHRYAVMSTYTYMSCQPFLEEPGRAAWVWHCCYIIHVQRVQTIVQTSTQIRTNINTKSTFSQHKINWSLLSFLLTCDVIRYLFKFVATSAQAVASLLKL